MGHGVSRHTFREGHGPELGSQARNHTVHALLSTFWHLHCRQAACGYAAPDPWTARDCLLCADTAVTETRGPLAALTSTWADKGGCTTSFLLVLLPPLT